MTQSDPNAPVPAGDPAETSQPATPPPSPPPAAPASIARELPQDMRAYHRWLVVMVALTIGATCLLISAGHGAKEGTRPWSPDSVLRVVVELLNFNYAYPTPRGNDVKWLAKGLGASAALMTMGIMWYVRTGRRKQEEELTGPAEPPAPRKPLLEQLSLVSAAQICLVAFGLWSLVSYRWAHWPAAAMGEGVRNLIIIAWAVALGRTMNRWSALRAGGALTAVLTLTSIIGLWYYYERNPSLRLEFPIGNPIFFAACMLPAILLAIAGMAGSIEYLARQPKTNASRPDADRIQYAPMVVLVASVVALGIISWAFALADSRAPAVALLAGLAAGAAALLIRWVPRERRRLAVLGMIVLVLAGIVLVGRPWMQSQAAIETGGRGASLRLRFYTWDYAKDLFLASPLAGQGQAAYLCLAQQMSLSPNDKWGRSDAEKDPTVFDGGLVGHAHNEWLQILAELGAIGFALMLTALGLTFWAGWRAFMRAEHPAHKWFILALMTGLLAIIVEECADVALRMPVLPLIFYTVIGLLWAFSSEAASGTNQAEHSHPAWFRPAGFAAAILAAMMMASAASRDWRGAIADGKTTELLEKQDWAGALAQASRATQNRLVIESQISANLQVIRAAHGGAVHNLSQLRNMVARQSSGTDRTRIRQIATEDIGRFEEFAQVCLVHGVGLWNAVPGMHSVAERLADVLLMKAELESLKPAVGLEPEQGPFLQTARGWLQMEFQRDRFNTLVGLRLLGLSGNRPVEEQLEILRIPLRRGPSPAGSLNAWQAALRQVAGREPSLVNHHLGNMLKAAETATAQAGPEQWPDPYAPETLRLKAMLERFAGEYVSAVEYASRAVQLYESDQLRLRYPTALSHGLGDLARHQLLADPEQPRKAVELARRALDEWPANVRSEGHTESLRRDLSLYLLAAGDEGAAADLIRAQVGGMSQDRLERNLGYGLAEVCGMFMDRSPEKRPALFDQWLSRSLSLSPDNPETRWLAFRVALENGNFEHASDHLDQLEKNLADPAQVPAMLRALLESYGDNPQAKQFLEERLARPDGAQESSGTSPQGRPPTMPAADTAPATEKPESEMK